MASALHDDDGIWFSIGGTFLRETDEAILLGLEEDDQVRKKSTTNQRIRHD